MGLVVGKEGGGGAERRRLREFSKSGVGSGEGGGRRRGRRLGELC